MDLAVGPIIEIVKCVGGPIVRYLKPQINFKDNLENFKRSKEDLCGLKGDIEASLSTQLRYGKIATEDVQRWLKDVEEFIARSDVEVEVNGWGCLSCCCRVKILEERTQEVKKIYSRGGKYTNECLVIDDPSAWAVELPATLLQGSEDVQASILACLKGKEVTKLGVWGMGGVGKTTIMKHVHNELLKEGKFKKIIWVSVSQNFDIYKLQEQIACSLKEQLEELQNAANRAAVLSATLEKQKPYLLILDDVWSSFELEDVGIPEQHVADGCKLVLTTRSQEIARSMGCKGIKVKTLSQEEALKLFLNKVGDTVLSDHRGGIKKDLASTLKEIVDECDGLPLAIVTVACSLRGTSDPQLWSAVLNELRNCKRNVAGTDDDGDAFRILKFSYDHLKNSKIQYCFLYCALYPEDYNIPKEEIIDYWIDEGFIGEMETRHAMKDEGHHILRKLEENSLVEFIKDKDEGDCVRMHKLIRDMALDITRTRPRFLAEAGKAFTELPEKVKCTEDVEKVSLMWNQIEEFPLSMASSTCRRLTTLLLAHNKLSTIPESVFEHMPELKILDLSFNEELRSLPNSVSKLVNLITLLLESTSLEMVPFLCSLASLNRLNLRGTKIKEVPEGLGMLTNLKCLFLCGSNGDNILEIDEIADGVLSNLSKLEELIVDRSKIELKGEVVGRLTKLKVFHGWFPTVNDMRIFLKCEPEHDGRLSSYFITVGSNLDLKSRVGRTMIEAIEMLPGYKKIIVFKENSIVGENTSLILPSIQVLCIEACDNLRSLDDISAVNDVKDLRRCWIYGCKRMEYVVSSWIKNPIVQTLEYLCLHDLDKLDGLFKAEVIANSQPPPGTFLFLKKIVIESCKKIKKLFPSWKLVQYLRSLREIDVRGCEEMEEIIGSDPEEGGDISNLILPELKYLKLLRLPALKSICSRRAVMVCDSLGEIQIRDCKCLRRIPLPPPPYLSYLHLSKLDNVDLLFEAEIIAKSPPPPWTFSSLKEVKIEGCKKIKKLFPSWKLVENLQSLEEIIVCDCKQMEEIIASDLTEGEKGGVTKLFLPKVKRLHLELLPALKSISNTRVKMVCDSLEHIQILQCHQFDNLDALFEEVTLSSLKTIWINGCGKIKKLFPSRLLLRNLPSLEEINVGCCEQMKELVASDPGGEKKGVMDVSLPKLKRLRLEFLPTLEVHSITAVMVCASLEEIQILACQCLMRIPLYLLDNLDAPFEAKVFSKSPQAPSIYSSLKTISIIECGNIKKLLPSRFLRGNLQSLEEIIVRDCEQMEEIIALDPEEEEEEEEEEEAEKGGVMKLILPKLKKLHLELLPALKSISSTRVKVVCDSLEQIQILKCCYLDNLDALFEVEGISMSPPPCGICPSLKTISIGYCYKIKKLFPSWMLQGNLQSLEEINVRHCVQMEELISLEPEEGVKEGLIKLALPKLKRLKLIYLPTLKRMCSTRAEMVCDSLQHVEILRCFHLEKLDALFKAVKILNLETIWINGCGKIKKLIPSGPLSLQSLEEINVSCCEQMEELVEKEADKDLSLPKLKKLHLECLPALEIHSITAVMVCASLEEIQILACQCLRRIPLYHLDNLDAPFKAKAFSKSLQPPAIYSSLKTISIIECGKIKKLLLSRFFLGNLQSLEEIIVRDCEQMEELIALDPEEDEKGGDVKLILPKLKRLHLELLPALKSICNMRVKVVCDSLEHIQILQCHHLDNLDDLFEVEGNSMSSPPPGICSSLKTIRIYECSKIKKLFPSKLMLGYLRSLEEINVRFCEHMEELVASDREEGELVMDLILPKLKWVELEGLPALKLSHNRTEEEDDDFLRIPLQLLGKDSIVGF